LVEAISPRNIEARAVKGELHRLYTLKNYFIAYNISFSYIITIKKVREFNFLILIKLIINHSLKA
jgi:hypothetical protein